VYGTKRKLTELMSRDLRQIQVLRRPDWERGNLPGDGSSIAYNLAFGSKYDGECIEHAKSIAP
jgi:hypothetical protein